MKYVIKDENLSLYHKEKEEKSLYHEEERGKYLYSKEREKIFISWRRKRRKGIKSKIDYNTVKYTINRLSPK